MPVTRNDASFTPYLEREAEETGWAMLALAKVAGDRARGFCRDEEVIELPDTLVRVRVVDATEGKPVSGAGVGVDNVGVRLRGAEPPGRGVVALKSGTGERGEVEIPGLAPGDWRIFTGGGMGREKVERTIQLREGDTVVVELTAVEE